MFLEEKEFKVIFRGVRGSHPICSQKIIKYGGNTSCVEVRVGGHLIILDAGTGIIGLGDDLIKSHISSGTSEENRKPIKQILLISHAHHDHIQGFPFYKPSYIPTSKMYVYGPKCFGVDFEEILSKSMFAPYSPVDPGEMSALIETNNIKETDTLIFYPESTKPEIRELHSLNESEIPHDAVTVKILKSYAHPKNGVFIFKISWMGCSLVYATDKESYVGGDSKLISFARNADLLIHDAQYSQQDYSSIINTKQGFGHSTPEMAVEIARLSNVKQLALFHLDPSYDDKTIEGIEDEVKKQFNNAFVAREGLEISLI